MFKIHSFTFNPFQENTYVLYNEKGSAIIIDAGCSNRTENQMLANFIEENRLTPRLLLNTHSHIDHVLGNRFVFDKYGLEPRLHQDDLPVFQSCPQVAQMYGFDYDPSPDPQDYLSEKEIIELDGDKLEVLLTPGHSPGHVVFYCEEQKFVIGGDVLFRGSIGRTDLPLGNHEQLLQSIREKLFVLPAEVKVYAGHMEPTTIGFEKANNPFF